MACNEILSLSEFMDEVDVGSLTDAQVQAILDRIRGKIENYLGHTFGRAMRVYRDGSGACPDSATITVTGTGVVLTVVIGGVTTTTTLTFVLYATLGAMADAIEAVTGWHASVPTAMSMDQASANLTAMSATSCLLSTNRALLCLKQWTECGDGGNEHNFFTKMPIRYAYVVTEDGVTLTAGTNFFVKTQWLIRYCATGNSSTCWSSAYWSCASPCNVCVTYLPTYFGRSPEEVRNMILALGALEVEMATTGTYKSESIGDYSYTKGSLAETWAFWLPFISGWMLQGVILP
jgi:hypothetical protein